MKPHQRITAAHCKLLNTAISQLGLDKADITARYRVKSTKELTNAQFDELMKHFRACGFAYQPKKPGGRGKAGYGGRGRPCYGKTTKADHLQAIGKALEALNRPWAYAESIAARMQFPNKLEWCSVEQLHKVQIALQYEARRQAGDPVERRPETLERRAAAAAAKRLQGRANNYAEPQP